MHHVCGEHEWNEGQSSHGPLTEMEGGKDYPEMDSKAAKELKKILLNPEWLKSLEFYVFFRYSSYLVQYLLLCDCGDHYTDSILTQFFSFFLIVLSLSNKKTNSQSCLFDFKISLFIILDFSQSHGCSV